MLEVGMGGGTLGEVIAFDRLRCYLYQKLNAFRLYCSGGL
jgi:hypothetical protein